VFTVGAPGLDQIQHTDLLSREELEAEIDFTFGDRTFLVTYHPATLGDTSAEEAVQALTQALDQFPEAHLLVTKANADPGGQAINEALGAYCADRTHARLYASLGQQRYLSALRQADVVVGNSSSGLIEAPAFDVPTVNIGPRQEGRLRGPSVIDCAAEPDAIVAAIRKACDPGFRASIQDATSPYGRGDTAEAIADRLKRLPLEEGAPAKPFFDLDISADASSAADAPEASPRAAS
jgi:UDP-N-acetylglucosamine 2-epimerase (non-hydrolysing)/GDP/UDP-N,N'-diacetylbacillosamine 2-epimerase (hydrolysing)